MHDVENIDPVVNPVLNREIYKKGGRVLIRLGDQVMFLFLFLFLCFCVALCNDTVGWFSFEKKGHWFLADVYDISRHARSDCPFYARYCFFFLNLLDCYRCLKNDFVVYFQIFVREWRLSISPLRQPDSSASSCMKYFESNDQVISFVLYFCVGWFDRFYVYFFRCSCSTRRVVEIASKKKTNERVSFDFFTTFFVKKK